MTPDSSWFVLLLMVVLVGLARACWHRDHLHQRPAPSAARMPRLLTPRTPNDCLACRQQAMGEANIAVLHPAVTPWSQIKSRRGAPKRIATELDFVPFQLIADGVRKPD